MPRIYPAIPEPAATVASLRETAMATKEVVEILAQQRGIRQILNSAVTWQDLLDLELVSPEQVPRK